MGQPPRQGGAPGRGAALQPSAPGVSSLAGNTGNQRYTRVLFVIDASTLQNDRGSDPLGGAWGVYNSICNARAALPARGAWTFLLFSSQVRAETRTATLLLWLATANRAAK